MTLRDAIKVTSLLQTGDILVIHTKSGPLSSAIQLYEKSLNRDDFPIYANHVLQIYNSKHSINQIFPKAVLSKNRSYLNSKYHVALVRPNLTEEESKHCMELMKKDIGTKYNLLQLVGFSLQWLVYMVFRKKIENYFDIKSMSVCSLSVLNRLNKISQRFDISKEEFHNDKGLVTPQDFLRACRINKNFKFIYGTGKFSEISISGESNNG